MRGQTGVRGRSAWTPADETTSETRLTGILLGLAADHNSASFNLPPVGYMDLC